MGLQRTNVDHHGLPARSTHHAYGECPEHRAGMLIVRASLEGGERMLLRGLTWLVLFQLIGTAINHLLVPVLPGPIIDLLLMLGYLVWRGEVGEPLSLAASSLFTAVAAGAAGEWG